MKKFYLLSSLIIFTSCFSSEEDVTQLIEQAEEENKTVCEVYLSEYPTSDIINPTDIFEKLDNIRKASASSKDSDDSDSTSSNNPNRSGAFDGGIKWVCLFLKSNGDPNMKDNNGLPLLSHVTSSLYVSSTKALLEAGASVDSSDKAGRTPLYYTLHPYPDRINERLPDRTDRKSAVTISPIFGLVMVISESMDRPRREAIVPMLLKTGADPNVKDNNNISVLHLATLHSTVEVVKELLASGAEVNAKTLKGESALHIAVSGRYYYSDRESVIQELIKSSADVNIQDEAGRTPLHFVASLEKDKRRKDEEEKESEKENEQLLKALLVAEDVNVNLRNEEGETALFLAVENQQSLLFIATLLEAGADPDIKAKGIGSGLPFGDGEGWFGDTPIDVAEDNDNEELVELLRSYSKMNTE